MDDTDLLNAAVAIGSQICRDAIWWQDRCNWLSDHPNGQASRNRFKTVTLGSNLYGGTSGLALFLAHLSRITGDDWFRKCARASAKQTFLNSAGESSLGLFNGQTGIGHTLMEVGKVLADDELFENGFDRICSAATSIKEGSQVEASDVIGGAAGIILAFSDLAERIGTRSLTEAGIVLADALIQSATQDKSGTSWSADQSSEQIGLTGFAHGTSGIAVALSRMKPFGDTRELDSMIEGALSYEHTHYLENAKNWLDLRKPGSTDRGKTMMAWCHGAPGIGLARLALMDNHDAPRLRHEADVALNSTAEYLNEKLQANDGNFSLCHGKAGNADILLSAARILDRPDFAKTARSVAIAGIEKYGDTKPPWPNGLRKNGYTVNLMLGIAGTGFFLLRLIDPDGVRSVLLPGLAEEASPVNQE